MEYALSYASQGYAVFPLKPNGKEPLTEHGFKDGTTDPEAIRQWWTSWPEANVGIVTGRQSGIVVLDIDRKHGVDGVESVSKLDLPRTLTIRTPSGGFHLFFKAPPSAIVPRKIGVMPGLDILGEGGYVVAAGSHINGCLYEIARNLPVTDCPQVLISLALSQKSGTSAPQTAKDEIAPGGRNAYLTTLGGKLRRIGLSVDEMTGALLILNTVRCKPPLSEAECRRIAASIGRYDPDAKAAGDAEKPLTLIVRPLPELLAASYPAPEFALEPLLPHPGLMMVYGPTGIAKTYFAIALGLAIASGHQILNYKSAVRRGVMYVDGELGNRAMQGRVRKMLSGHEFQPEGFYTLTRDDQAGGMIPDLNELAAQTMLLDAIPDDVDVVILDNLSTLTSSHGNGSSDSANSWDSWDDMQRLLLSLRRRGLSTIVVHHANKGGVAQSGTERKVHVMDTVVSLRWHKPPEGEGQQHDTVIEVHVVKGRNLPRGELEPFIATLSGSAADREGNQTLAWTTEDLGPKKAEQIESMLKMGMPISQIVTELGCASSFAYRVKDRLEGAGTLKYKHSGRGRKKGWMDREQD